MDRVVTNILIALFLKFQNTVETTTTIHSPLKSIRLLRSVKKHILTRSQAQMSGKPNRHTQLILSLGFYTLIEKSRRLFFIVRNSYNELIFI